MRNPLDPRRSFGSLDGIVTNAEAQAARPAFEKNFNLEKKQEVLVEASGQKIAIEIMPSNPYEFGLLAPEHRLFERAPIAMTFRMQDNSPVTPEVMALLHMSDVRYKRNIHPDSKGVEHLVVSGGLWTDGDTGFSAGGPFVSGIMKLLSLTREQQVELITKMRDVTNGARQKPEVNPWSQISEPGTQRG